MSVSDGARQYAAFVDRILRCREAEDDAKDDTKEVYAELKAAGFDKTVAGAHVNELRKKAKDSTKFDETNAILDLYRAAYDEAKNGIGTRLATHTHEAKRQPASIPDHDPDTGEITEPSEPATSHDARMATGEAGAEIAAASSSYSEMHQRPSINDEPYPEAGPQAQASLAGTGTGTLAGREGRIEGEAALAGLPTHPHLPEPPSSQVTAGMAGDVPSPASPAAISDEDVPNFLKPVNPDCQKAMRGESCALAHSSNVWCARQECASAAAAKRRKVAA